MKKYFLKGRTILILSVITLIFASCNTARIYENADFSYYISNHKTLAVIPPSVKVLPSKYETPEKRKNMEDIYPYTIQENMNSWFLKYHQLRAFHVKVQDIEKTNSTLKKIGYPNGEGKNMTFEELAQVLGVDALLLSDWTIEHYKNTGGGIAMLVMFPICPIVFIPTGIMALCTIQQRNNVVMKLIDGKTGDKIWQFDDNNISNYKKLCKTVPYFYWQ